MWGKLLCWLIGHRCYWEVHRVLSKGSEYYVWVPRCRRCNWSGINTAQEKIGPSGEKLPYWH